MAIYPVDNVIHLLYNYGLLSWLLKYEYKESSLFYRTKLKVAICIKSVWNHVLFFSVLWIDVD